MLEGDEGSGHFVDALAVHAPREFALRVLHAHHQLLQLVQRVPTALHLSLYRSLQDAASFSLSETRGETFARGDAVCLRWVSGRGSWTSGGRRRVRSAPSSRARATSCTGESTRRWTYGTFQASDLDFGDGSTDEAPCVANPNTTLRPCTLEPRTLSDPPLSNTQRRISENVDSARR